MAANRSLHFVFKIPDRKAASIFFRNILGMKVLRHEEFEEGCTATCNGPYDGKWSKTMVGYGPEDDHFVCELTYNYGMSYYEKGNDFLGIYIQSSEAVNRARTSGLELVKDGDYQVVKAAGGYHFYLLDKPQPVDKDPVLQVALASSNLNSSINYWRDILGMSVVNQESDQVCLEFQKEQAKLLLKDIGKPVYRAMAFGRIAFSCPSAHLKEIEAKIQKENHKILVPFTSLDTPGKATVQVVILKDPDGHEICFVGDEGFRALSKVETTASAILDEAIMNDKSDEWFAARGKSKDGP